MSFITQLTFLVGDGEFTANLAAVGPLLIGAIASGLICWIYLRERQKRWQHIVTIILLCLGIIFSGFMTVVPLIAPMKHAGAASSMIARGVTGIILSAIAVWIIVVLLQRSKAAKPAARASAHGR